MLVPDTAQCRHFFRLFLPLLLTQMAQIGTAVLSSIFSGQAGTTDLAGVAVGVNIWIPVSAASTGIFYGVTPIIAQLRGAGKQEAIPDYIVHSIYIAVFFAAATLFCGYCAISPLLDWMALEPQVRCIAEGFLEALGFGVLPWFLMATLRNVFDAHGKTHVSMCLLVFNMALTTLLFRLFIFGGPGIEPMGGIGTGYALTAASWVTLLLFSILLFRLKPFKDYHLTTRFQLPRWIFWLEQLRLGLPMAAAIFCETSLFSIVALLMSEYGTVFLAANQAAISYSTFTYTIPWSISLTATIVVGYEVGARHAKAARQYALLCQITALSLACFSALATYLFLDPIASLFTIDAETFTHIRVFLIYALCFCFCDALGTPVQGILRGYKDVKSITYIAFITYWGISLPLGYMLSHMTHLGAYGYWLGFIISLAIAAASYNLRLWSHTARQ